MTRYIDDHREQFGVQPICDVLGWCASTYYAHKKRPRSERALRDDQLKIEIKRVYQANYQVYGARKVWLQLNRDNITVARCTVERLMRQLGLQGVRRGAVKRTTIAADTPDDRPDLVDRDFTADRPDAKWVADLTYVSTRQGWAYVALIIDCFSRAIVGWQVAPHMRTNLVLDALKLAVWQRDLDDDPDLIHHSDRGSQYVAVAYTDELDTAGLAPSVGSVGDCLLTGQWGYGEGAMAAA